MFKNTAIFSGHIFNSNTINITVTDKKIIVIEQYLFFVNLYEIASGFL